MMMSDALVIAVGTHNKSKLVFGLYVGLHDLQSIITMHYTQ